MKTFGSQLDLHKGFGPGFDFLRVFLAISIASWHTLQVAHGDLDDVLATPLWFLNYALVSMFFALSGFLVAGSGLRLSLRNFLINRGLRIVPALAVEILFSALLLGTIFTTLPLRKYFETFEFWHYMTNIVGVINYYLPGVFKSNPNDQVNAVLWTVPYEIGCYAIMSVFIATKLIRKPIVIALFTIALMVTAVAFDISGVHGRSPIAVKMVIAFLFLNAGAKLWPVFLLGILAYLWRFKIPYHWGIALYAAFVCVAIAIFVPSSLFNNTLLHLVALPWLVYLTAFIGLTPLTRLPLYHRGDYSYGIYLYHWPFMQALVALFPGISAFWLFLLAIPTSTIVAALSWHVIESPILGLRKRFSFVAQAKHLGESSAEAIA